MQHRPSRRLLSRFIHRSLLEQASPGEGENDRYKLTLFDFRVRRATSIDCDTHKVSGVPFRAVALLKRHLSDSMDLHRLEDLF